MKRLVILLAAAVVACEGPREDAGEQADFSSGAVNSEDTLRQGPAEQLGEKQDRVADTRKRSQEAEADVLEVLADERRERAEQEANELENRADAIRSH